MTRSVEDHGCTSHHQACICREAYFDELERENGDLLQRVEYAEAEVERLRGERDAWIRITDGTHIMPMASYERMRRVVEAARELEQDNAKFVAELRAKAEWTMGIEEQWESPLVVKIREALAALDAEVSSEEVDGGESSKVIDEIEQAVAEAHKLLAEDEVDGGEGSP